MTDPTIFFKLPDLLPEEAMRLEQNIHTLIISKVLFTRGGSITIHFNAENVVQKITGDPVLYLRKSQEYAKLK